MSITNTNQISASVRRIEDSLQALDKRVHEGEKQKIKQSSVDVYAFSKHIEASIVKSEHAQAENLKRCVQMENSTRTMQTEI